MLGFLDPVIEHIGSTSVKGLSAKPIIDILIGVSDEDVLEKAIAPLLANGYVHYAVYNTFMPYRRFFVKHKISRCDLALPDIITAVHEIPTTSYEHNQRLAHIHILPFLSEHWIRHLAFRDYLRTHAAIRTRYQALKERLSQKEWPDGTDYNNAKDAFLKLEERRAVVWYRSKEL